MEGATKELTVASVISVPIEGSTVFNHIPIMSLLPTPAGTEQYFTPRL